MPIQTMTDIPLKGKRVLIREDLNVPIRNGTVTSDARILAAIPTIRQALAAGAKVMILSHLGRPDPSVQEPQLSLAPVAAHLSKFLGEVPLITNWVNGFSMENHEVVLLENVRFNAGETENSPELARKMAKLCDVFVMDAFATAHRSEASTCGIIEFAPAACAGPLLMSELEALTRIMHKPARPVVAIVGGSKVSTKLSLLDALAAKVDTLIVGGGIANTFLAAEGYTVGRSLCEPDLIDEAERLTLAARSHGADIPLPTDVIVSEKLTSDADSAVRLVSQVDDSEKIYDIGPDTIKRFVSIIKKAKTILWNGPVGAFEIEQFSKGTRAIAKAIADSPGFSVAGGGDTLAAIEAYGVGKDIDYISTGGGAFLSFIEGKTLPAIAALEARIARDEQIA